MSFGLCTNLLPRVDSANVPHLYFPQPLLAHGHRLSCQVSSLLHRLHTLLDGLASRHGLWRADSKSGAYLAVANLHLPQPADHAARVASFALEAVRATAGVAVIEGDATAHLGLRVGVHVGPVTGSVVGKASARYMLFGPAVSIAQRLERLGAKGRVHVSEAAAARMRAQAGAEAGFQLTPRGHITAGSGAVSLRTLWLQPLAKLPRSEASSSRFRSSASRDGAGSLGGIRLIVPGELPRDAQAGEEEEPHMHGLAMTADGVN